MFLKRLIPSFLKKSDRTSSSGTRGLDIEGILRSPVIDGVPKRQEVGRAFRPKGKNVKVYEFDFEKDRDFKKVAFLHFSPAVVGKDGDPPGDASLLLNVDGVVLGSISGPASEFEDLFNKSHTGVFNKWNIFTGALDGK